MVEATTFESPFFPTWTPNKGLRILEPRVNESWRETHRNATNFGGVVRACLQCVCRPGARQTKDGGSGNHLAHQMRELVVPKSCSQRFELGGHKLVGRRCPQF
jgi:hypothetical protein